MEICCRKILSTPKPRRNVDRNIKKLPVLRSAFTTFAGMAKKEIRDSIEKYDSILSDIRKGIFSPFYVLMGEEPYYSDSIIDEISEYSLTSEEKGFNYLVLYGSDTNATQVVELARRFPMLASRQVVIVKEAQMMGDMRDLEFYFSQPLSTTLLVISLTNKSLDKRSTLYKTANSKGIVLESFSLRDEMVPGWIETYMRSKSLSITPEAGALMAEYCGPELRKLVLELDKLITNLPEDRKRVEIIDIEENIGISREFNVFELTRALSFKDSAKIFRIVDHFGASPKQYPLVMTLASLFMHFSRIVKYHSLFSGGKRASTGEIASTIGINPYFLPEYETAARNYPLIKCMEAISLIRKCDSASKSNDRGEATDGELLFELVFRITH